MTVRDFIKIVNYNKFEICCENKSGRLERLTFYDLLKKPIEEDIINMGYLNKEIDIVLLTPDLEKPENEWDTSLDYFTIVIK